VIGGALLAVVGAWVLCQVLGGNALGRLGITGDPTGPAKVGKVGTKRKGPALERGD
jgi:hypothetical protein